MLHPRRPRRARIAGSGIIDNQHGRRNVEAIDRIALQARKEEIVARKARENLKTSTGGSNSRPLAKLPKAEAINTRATVAKAAGVGERTYDAGKRAGSADLESPQKSDGLLWAVASGIALFVVIFQTRRDSHSDSVLRHPDRLIQMTCV